METVNIQQLQPDQIRRFCERNQQGVNSEF
jgi:hypothetical protein